jgi:peptidoglycan lytic transglycosylase
MPPNDDAQICRAITVVNTRHCLARSIRLAGAAVAIGSLIGCLTPLPPVPAPRPAPIVAQPTPRPPPAQPAFTEAKASWYGPRFAGRKTSTGERYNPNALTAASKTLPIGSVVRVTNPDNGRSVNVRINDRGPFTPGRSLDLSRRAARKLGIIRKGVARVNLVLPDPLEAMESSIK